jgi:hypothetical protein
VRPIALVYQSSGLKSHNFTNPFPWGASSSGLFPDRIVSPPYNFFRYGNSPILLLASGGTQLLIIKNGTKSICLT